MPGWDDLSYANKSVIPYEYPADWEFPPPEKTRLQMLADSIKRFCKWCMT